MGKKKNKDKKGKGAEKTLLKTEKKLEKKSKKQLAEAGEEDIESLIAHFKEQDRRKVETFEEKCGQPSSRCNMTLAAHPDRDELIMFGGEFYNGHKTFLYNDLFFYNCKRKDWTKVMAPNPPPPRCAHQAVALKQLGGQLWIFGGEFASPSQSQFYHYKDLWMFSLKDRKWQEIKAAGGPSSRSGHRMVAFKKQLLVFGGFHDNTRNYKYFNDLYSFNLETYTWCKIDAVGIPPTPRSSCQMIVAGDSHHVVVFGGYSKETVKRDVEKGVVHTEVYTLSPHESRKADDKPGWKWNLLKNSGFKPTPRTGMTGVAIPGNKALFFGGVFDEKEDDSDDDDDDDDLKGNFYNDLFTLDLDKGKWHETILRGKMDTTAVTKRRRRREAGDDEETMDDNGEENDEEEDMETESMDVQQQQAPAYDDGIFTVTVGPQSGSSSAVADASTSNRVDAEMEADLFIPRPRMNASLTVSNGLLYLYGGFYEEGSKQITLSDFYSIDVKKLDEFTIIVADESNKMVWVGSESEDSEDEDNGNAKKTKTKSVSDEEDDEESDDDDEDMAEPPAVNADEDLAAYYSRTKDFWMDASEGELKSEGKTPTEKQVKKVAKKMVEMFYKDSTTAGAK